MENPLKQRHFTYPNPLLLYTLRNMRRALLRGFDLRRKGMALGATLLLGDDGSRFVESSVGNPWDSNPDVLDAVECTEARLLYWATAKPESWEVMEGDRARDSGVIVFSSSSSTSSQIL